MRRAALLVCAGVVFCLLLPTSVLAWVFAGPSPFRYGDIVWIDAGDGATPESWCFEYDGCYISYWYNYVEASGDDGYYADIWAWDEYAEVYGEDYYPGLVMRPMGYYSHAQFGYEVWYCYGEEECRPDDGYWDFGWTSATVQPDPCWPFPVAESSRVDHWEGSPAPQVGFLQTLTPETPGASIGAGRRVNENNGPGQDPLNDTCHFPTSLVPPAYQLSGGTWFVDASNTWCCDFVGWTDVSPYFAISYYRAQRVTPCQTTIPQTMVMLCVDHYVPYNTSNLELGFTDTTVWGKRLDIPDEHAY